MTVSQTTSSSTARPVDPPVAAPRHGAGILPMFAVAPLSVVAFMAAWSPNRPLLSVFLIGVSLALTPRMPRLRTPDVLALLLGMWALIALTWAVDHELTALSATKYASACLFFFAVRHVAVRRGELLAIGYSYLAGCIIPVFQLIRDSRLTGAPVRMGLLDLNVRYGVEGANINYTAYSLVTAFIITILLLRVEGQPRAVRIGLYILLPALAYAVLLNGTRGALIALAMVLLYRPISRPAPRLAGWLLAVAVPAILTLVPLGLGKGTLLWLDDSFGYRSTGDASGRLLVWPYASSSWSEALWFGHGPGSFPLENPFGIGAHTLVLTLGNDLGLVGVMLFAAVFAAAMIRPASGAVRIAELPGAARERYRLAGMFVVGMAPVWLTGHWENALGLWLALALVSAFPSPLRTRVEPRHRKAGHEREVFFPASRTAGAVAPRG